MHMIPSQANSHTKLDHVPARQCILPKLDKTTGRIALLEQMCNRPLTAKEKELLQDVNILFQPNASYSPMLTREHVTLLSKCE